MGTSVNQRSPSTPNWQAAITSYLHPDIPVNRVMNEIWRAVANQPEGNLLDQLSLPIVAECLRIVETSNTRAEAVYAARRFVASSGQASLAADLAQRAIAQSFVSEADRASAYSQALFSEAGNYLVSRDLPGFVGGIGRVANISEAISFKEMIKREITKSVRSVPLPRDVSRQPAKWNQYVDEVVNQLSGRK